MNDKSKESSFIEADKEQAKWFKEDTKKYKQEELRKLIDQKKKYIENAKKVKDQIKANHIDKVQEAEYEKM